MIIISNACAPSNGTHPFRFSAPARSQAAVHPGFPDCYVAAGTLQGKALKIFRRTHETPAARSAQRGFIRTRSRCCLPCRCPIRISRRPVSASSLPAIRRHRWIRRPVAVSTLAARSLRVSALRSFPSLRKLHLVTAARATSRSRSRSRNRTSTCSRLLSFGPALKLFFRTSSDMQRGSYLARCFLESILRSASNACLSQSSGSPASTHAS